MNQSARASEVDPKIAAVLPEHRGLYFDGKWQRPSGGYLDTYNPANGASLGTCPEGDAHDVDNAARAAHKAFREWRRTTPLDRGTALKKTAHVLLDHTEELALLDAANCG